MFSVSCTRSSLSNGLEVVLHEDHSLPIVAVNVWYHVGSKDEETGRTGFAHLFEHVMFEGSKHHNKSFFEPLQKVGAVVNGSTTPDRTNYWENVPSNYLELALWLEADRMGFLLDALDQKRFDVQRDVVKNERRQSYENRPYGLAELALQPAVFPSPHPYNWTTIGSQQDLDSASLDDVKGFFSRFYTPSNASLAIVGDFDSDEAKRLIEYNFGDLPPGPSITRVGRMDSSLTGEVRVTMRDKVQLPRLYIAWPACPMFDEDEAALDVLATVLSDGKTSRLYRSLVYEKQIARDVRVGSYTQEIAGEFHIQVTASPGHTVEEVHQVVEGEVDRIRREGPSQQEIDRAFNRIEAQHVRHLERFGGFGGRADQLNLFNVMAGDPGVINTDMERYKAVTVDDVARLARSTLNGDRVRLAVLPETSASPTRSGIQRSVMPGSAKPRTYTPPVPGRSRLSGGLDVLHVEKPGVPIVAFGLLLRAGAITDSARRPGLSHMTAAMLLEGTTSRSSQQIASEMEYMGSHLDSDAGREHVMLSAQTTTQHWSKGLEVLADVVKNPTFPEHELERLRKERLADLKRIADDPASIAMRAARAIVYGPKTRYGHPISGTKQSVGALTQAEVRRHFLDRYGPEEATLIVVGDLSDADALSMAESYLGDWGQQTATDGQAKSPPESAPSASTAIYLADKPGAAQSVIRAGVLTIPRHDPDFYALNLVNYVFGGQFTARLMMNLRQDKGYSYGYSSTIDWLTGPSVLLAGGSVETGVTREAVDETLKEFADIRGRRPVTEDEFRRAKDGIFKGFPTQFESQFQVLHQLSRITIFDLPDDYYSHLMANLEAVTLEEVHRVAHEKIDDQHLSVLVVGDREVVEPGLRELGLPIIPVDYEGNPLQ